MTQNTASAFDQSSNAPPGPAQARRNPCVRSDTAFRLVINGRFLSQRATGVQRVAQEVTRAIDRMLGGPGRDALDVRLVVQADADVTPLGLRHIAVTRAAGPGGHLWEQLVLPRHVGDATLLCLGNSAPIASLFGRRPVGVMLHDQAHLLFRADYSAGYRLWHRVLDAAILARARPMFTVSESERAVIAGRHPRMRAPIVVAPNGSWIDDRPVAPDPAATDPAATDQAPRRYGLYVGSFTARKNIAALFETARELAEREGMAFRFVGPPNAASRAFEASLAGPARALIRFPGFVSDDALGRLYRDALCLLYPSFYEASGLPPSEAMTFGCPVIASDLPVLRERCGDAALYCDPHDPRTLTDAVLRLAHDPALAQTLADRGRLRARTFTWEAQAARIISALAPAASGVPA